MKPYLWNFIGCLKGVMTINKVMKQVIKGAMKGRRVDNGTLGRRLSDFVSKEALSL